MQSILTQREIDELLSEDEVKTNDGVEQSQRSQSENDIKVIQKLQEALASKLSDKLTVLLQTKISIRLQNIKKTVISFEQIMHQSSVVFGCFELKASQQRGVYCFDLKLAYSMIERLLGGDGMSGYCTEELTEIEKRIFYRIEECVIESMQTEWQYNKFTSLIQNSMCDEQGDNTLQKNVIIVTMHLSLATGIEGELQFYWPLAIYKNFTPFKSPVPLTQGMPQAGFDDFQSVFAQ